MKAESFLILAERQVEQKKKEKKRGYCLHLQVVFFSFSSRSLRWSLKKKKKKCAALCRLHSRLALSACLLVRMRKIKAETHKNNKDKWKRRGTVSHHSILSRRVLKSKRLKPSTKTHHYIQSGWDPRGSSLSLSPSSPIFSVVLFLLFSVSRPLSSCFPWYPRCLLSSSPAHPPFFLLLPIPVFVPQ